MHHLQRSHLYHLSNLKVGRFQLPVKHAGRLMARYASSWLCCPGPRRSLDILPREQCDARRPSCSACAFCSKDCIYTVEPNMTRPAAAKRKLQTSEKRLTDFEDLFHHLRSRPEKEATRILQRICAGCDVPLSLNFIKDGDLLFQPNMASAARNQSAHSPSVSILDFAMREHEHRVWAF